MRTALYVPGSSPRMIEKSRTLAVDVVIFDLEDAVSHCEKDAARGRVAEELTREAPMTRWVRVNPVGSAEHVLDLKAILPASPDAILLPMADPESLAALDRYLDGAGGESNIPIVALVETARGLLEVALLCQTSDRLIGLQLGAEDLTAQLGVERTQGGEEIRFARHQLALAAHAYGLMAIDTPNLRLGDDDDLRADIAIARSSGMTAKTCIHPSQLAVVAEAFRPSETEIAWAERVLAAADHAAEEGKGAVALDGQMIDAPVVARARRVLAAQN